MKSSMKRNKNKKWLKLQNRIRPANATKFETQMNKILWSRIGPFHFVQIAIDNAMKDIFYAEGSNS